MGLLDVSEASLYLRVQSRMFRTFSIKCWTGGPANISVKDQAVNISGFGGYKVSVAHKQHRQYVHE